MIFSDDDLLPISALQHLMFCERQCALIHIEGLWAENRLTAEGKELHERAHDRGHETRKNVRAVRALRLQSVMHGITGVADVVEFHAPSGRVAKELSDSLFWQVPGVLDGWRIVPIEYKRGRRKEGSCDEIQLCAQGLCLEEMLGVTVIEGAIYYGQEQGRIRVDLTSSLREKTVAACRRLRDIIDGAVNPPAIYGKHCDACSLVDLCMPSVTKGERSVGARFSRAVSESLASQAPREDPDPK